MVNLKEITHHATLITTSERKKVTEEVCNQILQSNLNNIVLSSTVIDIDTARELISWAQTPHSGKKYAVVSFSSITIPAQNALLKITEDTPPNTHFIFITTNKETLLPTLQSRLSEVIYEQNSTTENSDIDLFLRTPANERMKLSCIQNIINAQDEKGRKDREVAKLFLTNLTSNQKLLSHPNVLSQLIIVIEHISTPSASIKALLEYTSLLTPTYK